MNYRHLNPVRGGSFGHIIIMMSDIISPKSPGFSIAGSYLVYCFDSIITNFYF
ncbi:hypothetical protein SAMN05421876_101166 [Kaistella jeonii]|nr:hypothetical protein SAMN05421876_101166 [Kaistella jeonii]VEI94765.1 Uncharacterised protein [Kaistella jeonii]